MYIFLILAFTLLMLSERSFISLDPATQDFVTLFLSIIIEAFPFVVLGILISIFVDLFVSTKIFKRILSKNKVISNLQISFFGAFMPVCECGNVPVARRFIMKGFSVPQTVTFLLAAPIINPITIYSTLAAFGWDSNVVGVRVIAAIVIANVTGLLFYRFKKKKDVLSDEFIESCKIAEGHNHKHTWKSIFTEGGEIFTKEFSQIMSMLVFGAFIAALSQIIIPRDVITSIGSHGILSIVAMMILAFVISICSNVDAFFALSYANSFTLGSIVSFLVFGPMIDIKMLSMLKTTFTTRALVYMSLLVGIMSFAIGVIVNLII